MSGVTVGAITAILSAVFNGSFAAVSKIPAVAKHDLDPMLFMCYFTVGFFILSWLTVPVFPFVFALELNNETNNTLAGGTVYVWDNWGILAGLFQDLAITFSFLAIPRVGLSIGQGVWGGTSILVAIILGIAVVGNKVQSPYGLGFAIVILLASVAGIAFCNEIGQKFAVCKNPRGSSGSSEDTPPAATSGVVVVSTDGVVVDEAANEGLLGDAAAVPEELPAAGKGATRTPKDFAIGICSAALVGLFGGSILVPLNFAAPAAQGLVFVPSQGVGALIFAPVIAVVWFVARRQKPVFHLKGTLLPGICSGIIWGFGDICSVFAIPFVGYAVAYPILQCALLISGLWGVFAFREVKLCGAKVTFFVSGVVLIGGAFLLATSVAT